MSAAAAVASAAFYLNYVECKYETSAKEIRNNHSFIWTMWNVNSMSPTGNQFQTKFYLNYVECKSESSQVNKIFQ